MVSDRALHISSASFCKANGGITQEEFFSSSSFLLLMFIFCGAALHGLLWLLALCIKKNVQEFKAFYLKFAKGCLFCKGVKKHFKFLKYRLM